MRIRRRLTAGLNRRWRQSKVNSRRRCAWPGYMTTSRLVARARRLRRPREVSPVPRTSSSMLMAGFMRTRRRLTAGLNRRWRQSKVNSRRRCAWPGYMTTSRLVARARRLRRPREVSPVPKTSNNRLMAGFMRIRRRLTAGLNRRWRQSKVNSRRRCAWPGYMTTSRLVARARRLRRPREVNPVPEKSNARHH